MGLDPPARLRLAVLAIGALLAVGLWTQLDLDGDRLTTQQEWATRTDSLRADTDGDTVDDGWEVGHGLKPLDSDSDGDTLDDRRELALATDPLSPDADADGVGDPEELDADTDPRDSDSDDDTLGDALERAVGTGPLRADTDGDGLGDAREVLDRGDPFASDTDGDGIGDAAEPRTDCNGDGRLGLADADDDADQRTDGEEPPAQRCAPDVDFDGVLDGQEASLTCVARADCDGDSLGDGAERAAAFDPLNSDTFGTGLDDAIALAFQQRSQPPSGDADDDGIPDAWESTTGLLDWGTLQPRPGQRDLLVEFVRVEGPDSGRYAYLDFRPAYAAVEEVFDAAGLGMQWVETVVRRGDEQRPSLIPSSDSAYYRDVLTRARHSTNPYVTTVVLNPQLDQGELLHSGVAPIRGTLAAVDYGQHSTVHFLYDYVEQVWNGTAYVPVARVANLDLSPIYESWVVGDRQDVLQGGGLQGGGIRPDGDFFLRGDGWTLRWRPYWFAGNPVVEGAGGSRVQLRSTGATVDAAELARTVLHELGHTLGLCHAHDAACWRNFTPADQARTSQSTMSYASTGLAFLPSEWRTVGTYLTCPPQEPLAILAGGASAAEVIAAKYDYALRDILNIDQRHCGVPTVLPRDLEPDLAPVRFDAPYAAVGEADLTLASHLYALPWPAPPRVRNSDAGTVGYAGASAALVLLAAFAAPWVAAGRWRQALLAPSSAAAVASQPAAQGPPPVEVPAPAGAPPLAEEFPLADGLGLLDRA